MSNTNNTGIPGVICVDTDVICDEPYMIDVDHSSMVGVGDDTITVATDLQDAMNAATITLDPSTTLTAGSVDLAGAVSVTGTTFAFPTVNNVSDDSKHTFGDTVDDDRHKIYIVEPWQSRKPIPVDGGMHVSMEEDLLSQEELKEKILESMSETHPETIIKVGLNPDNIKLVRNEVTIEIKKDTKE